MNTKRKKGFTLVELLVVIAIIALLMSMLVPALQRARRLARKVVCASNMRQWGIAISAYAAANDGYFPNNGYDPVRNSRDFAEVSGIMSQFFEDYLFKLDQKATKAGTNILFCPTETYHRWRYQGQWDVIDPRDWIDKGMIGYNVLFGNDWDLIRSINSPSKYTLPTCPNGLKWVTRKMMGGNYSKGPILSDFMYSWGRDRWYNEAPISSHASLKDFAPEGGNFLFEDGSVRWYRGVHNGMESFHGGEIKIGGIEGPWLVYFGLPDVR